MYITDIQTYLDKKTGERRAVIHLFGSVDDHVLPGKVFCEMDSPIMKEIREASSQLNEGANRCLVATVKANVEYSFNGNKYLRIDKIESVDVSAIVI